MSDSRIAGLPRTAAVVLGAVVLVLVVAVGVWAVTARDGADAGETAAASATPTPSPSDDPSASPAPTDAAADESPAPVRDPDAAAPAAPPAAGQAVAGPDGRPTLAPVAIDAAVEPAAGVTARVALVEDVVGEAVLPGEVGGPAARVHVEVVNGTDAALDLTLAVLNAYTGADLVPAGELSSPGVVAFPPSVPPGGTARAAYVVRIDPAQRQQVRFELDLGGAAAVAHFDGPLPN